MKKINKRKIIGIILVGIFFISALFTEPFYLFYLYQKLTGIVKNEYEIGSAKISFLDYDKVPTNIPNIRYNNGNEYKAFLIGSKQLNNYSKPFVRFGFDVGESVNIVGFYEKSYESSLYFNRFKRLKEVAEKYRKEFDKSGCFPQEQNSFNSISEFSKKLAVYGNGEFICCSIFKGEEVCATRFEGWVGMAFPQKSFSILTNNLHLTQHFDVEFKE